MCTEVVDRIRAALIASCLAGALAGGLLLPLAPIRSRAQDDTHTVVFRRGQDGYDGCADTYISEFSPNLNFGYGELQLGEKGRISLLIRFDVSTVPSDVFIHEATLWLYAHNYGQREGPIGSKQNWKRKRSTKRGRRASHQKGAGHEGCGPGRWATREGRAMQDGF